MSEPIPGEDMAMPQFHDPSFLDTLRSINEEMALLFGENEHKILSAKVTHYQILFPQALKQLVVRIQHYARLVGHPGGRRLCHYICMDMYWPALVADYYATV